MDCEIGGYLIDLTPLTNRASQSSFRRIVLQLPDGLKHKAYELVECVDRTLGGGYEILTQADSIFGACDLQLGKLSILGEGTLIAHIGHTPYPRELGHTQALASNNNIIYLQARSTIEASQLEKPLRRAASYLLGLGLKSVGLLATAQHVHILRDAARILAEEGVEPLIPRGQPPFFEDGQVIGCDYRLARRLNVEGYIIVSGGLFHPLGLYLSTLKPVIQVDPYRREYRDITQTGEKVYRKRLLLVSNAMNARSVGLIIGLKEGQYRPWLINIIESKAKKNNIKVYKYLSENLTYNELGNIDSPKIDAFIITSCPRLAIDDFGDYHKPVLTPGEAIMALDRTLSPYRFPW
jgi:2-(3-amino-3-carboxypropyl)histidine synthase